MMIPEPDAPAPYTDASRAKLAVSLAARELSDSARGFVAIRPGTSRPGAAIEDVARLVADAQRLLELSVIAEVIGGATWEQVGDALDITRQSAHARFSADVKAFNASLADGNWTPEGADDPDRWAPRLDEWVVRHREPGEYAGQGGHPVSGGLARLDPHSEIMQLDGERYALLQQHLAPPVDEFRRIAERQLVLWQRMADDPERRDSERRIAAQAVDETRARLAELPPAEPTVGTLTISVRDDQGNWREIGRHHDIEDAAEIVMDSAFHVRASDYGIEPGTLVRVAVLDGDGSDIDSCRVHAQ